MTSNFSNRKPLKLLGILFLFVSLATFINCENNIIEEDVPEQQENLINELPKVKTMAYQDVPQNFNDLKGYYKLSNHLEGDTQFAKDGHSKNDIVIHTDVIKEVTLGDYKSYTMRITLPKAPSNKLFNITIEEKNGEEGLFLTTYTLNNVTARGGGGGAEVGTARTQRYEGFETIPPDGGGGTEENWGSGTGGGTTGTLAEYSEVYPYDCEGDILMKDERVETRCTCHGQHTLAQIFDCTCIAEGGDPPMVRYVTMYLCVPYENEEPDPNTGTTTPTTGAGNGTSGSGDNETPSVTVIVEEEVCDELPPTDLDGMCTEAPFETCLLGLRNNNIFRLNTSTLQQFKNYINANGCGGNEGFLNEAVDALVEGGEVDLDNEIIKDATFVDTKADCVLSNLIQQNGYFKNVMNAFTDDNSEFKIKFKVGELDSNNSGGDGQASKPDANNIVTITLVPDLLNKNALEIAGVILHEGVHAQLHRMLASDNKAKYNLSDADFEWLKDLIKFWEGESEFPLSSAQHDFMSVRYVDPIAKSVRNFDSNTHPLENYMRFGWDGLYDFGRNRGLIDRAQLNEYITLAEIPKNDNHKTSCD